MNTYTVVVKGTTNGQTYTLDVLASSEGEAKLNAVKILVMDGVTHLHVISATAK